MSNNIGSNSSLTYEVIKGLARSKLFRAVILTGVVFGAVFVFASNPVGWVASALSVSLLTAKILIGISVPVLCAALACVQMPLPGTIEFEISALCRLCKSKTRDEIIITEWKKDMGCGKIFLGSLPNRLRYDVEGIGAVLSVNERWERKAYGLSVPFRSPDWRSMGIEYNWIESEDHTLLSPKGMDEGADWINTQLNEKKSVLVHCRAGVGRSATIIAAYLMKYAKGKNGTLLSLGAICHGIKESRKDSTIWNKLEALEAYDRFLKTYDTNVKYEDEDPLSNRPETQSVKGSCSNN